MVKSSPTSCGWLFDTGAPGVGELKRLPDSIGNTPGVVEEPIEPIDEPMKEGISPMGAAGKLLAGCCLEKLPGASIVSEGCGMMLSNAVTPVYCNF